MHAQEAHGHGDSEPKEEDARCLVWDYRHLVRTALMCLALALMLHLLRLSSPYKCSTGDLGSRTITAPRLHCARPCRRTCLCTSPACLPGLCPYDGRCWMDHRHKQPSAAFDYKLRLTGVWDCHWALDMCTTGGSQVLSSFCPVPLPAARALCVVEPHPVTLRKCAFVCWEGGAACADSDSLRGITPMWWVCRA